MFGRPKMAGRFDPEDFGPNTLRLVGNLCFALFVLGVVVFTIIAATYQPDDPLLRATSKIESFLTSTSNSTFLPDHSVLRTGEDFLNPSDLPASRSVDLETETQATASTASAECDPDKPIDCAALRVFHLMMKEAMDRFKDVHFYRFGKPASGDNSTSCDMAWRFRPKEAKRAALYKDYRRFVLRRNRDCSHSVVSVGDYHSGINARKNKNKNKGDGGGDGWFRLRKRNERAVVVSVVGEAVNDTIPVVGEAVNDTFPVVESESKFAKSKYLIYMDGGDRCKSMDHFLWSFLCALGEAQHLNRTLVMDRSICLNSMYSSTGQDEEGKDLRFYFDFEHLNEASSVIDQNEFWTDWGKWQKKNKLGLHLVEDFRVTPMKLSGVKDTLIMRKFGNVEPDNYWYRVCEGETESVIQRPWHLVWKSKRLLEIVSAIAAKMNWDFESVHIVRGEKAKNTKMWPKLAADTSPDALLTTLGNKIDDGRTLYIATDEHDTSFFNPLRDKYTIHFLDDFKELWGEGSEWYMETKQLNNGIPVEFDGYMRREVDTEVFLRGKKQLETFNDLTSDCKDGINTCKQAAI